MTTVAVPAKEWTYADYLALPDNDEGTRYEIIEGELIIVDSPTPIHQ